MATISNITYGRMAELLIADGNLEINGGLIKATIEHQYYEEKRGRYYFNFKDSFLVYYVPMDKKYLEAEHSKTDWYKHFHAPMGKSYEWKYFGLTPCQQYFYKITLIDNPVIDWDASFFYLKYMTMKRIDWLFLDNPFAPW